MLWLFYLFDCLKFTEPGSLAWTGRYGKLRRGWRKRDTLIPLGGIAKDVIPAPLIPWPQAMIVASRKETGGRFGKVRNIRRMSRFVIRATSDLRWSSLFIFILFFILIPVIYVMQRGELTVLLAIACGLMMMFLNACVYASIHRRLLPKEKADRFKGILFTAFLPWHAMRCADEIIIKFTTPWSQPAVLAAHLGQSGNLKHFQTLYRKACYHPKPEYTRAELDDLLDQVGTDPTPWLKAPEIDDPYFCPCCHESYTVNKHPCEDCGGIELIATN
ncbi:MAG: hypothetical protein ACPGUY_10515 [Akkermansiaceae bacterium]